MEPEDRQEDVEPTSGATAEPDPEEVAQDDRDPEIEPRAEAKMRRGPIEDKMLRPHEVGAEDKQDDPTSGGLESVEFGSSAARELAESWGLSAEDFEDEQPSGATGFVKNDVERIIGDYEPTGP